MDQWLQRFRSAKTVADQPRVLVPGDTEREMEAVRLADGIPLLDIVVDDLTQVGSKLEVTFEH
jgi:L-2-hydroxycarboxylate dehydrogenase (NAD+)